MQSGWIEIFFLAMLAGFIGLRLYHALGKRTGHEKPVSDSFRSGRAEVARPDARQANEAEMFPLPELPADIEPGVRPGLEAVMQADRSFDPARFLASAQTAYAMVLESFWNGDIDALPDLVSDEILGQFRAAIAARADAGERLDNRLLQVDRASIVDARINGTMADVTIRFDAEIVSATRDSEGRVIAGNPDASVQTHDIWTFSRHTASRDPAWLVVAIDEEA
ncbi:MAG: Tim44/TimA family putative adaptor protein [Sphingomonadaceae bacterium]